MPDYKKEYIHWKTKYLNLKKKIKNNQSGGFTNGLIQGEHEDDDRLIKQAKLNRRLQKVLNAIPEDLL